MKVIGNVTHSTTQEFQCATFLNDAMAAYDILDELLEDGWYPQDTDAAWTDIAVLDDKYYAAFGEDNVGAQNAALIYVEIEPSAGMIRDYDYFKQY